MTLLKVPLVHGTQALPAVYAPTPHAVHTTEVVAPTIDTAAYLPAAHAVQSVLELAAVSRL